MSLDETVARLRGRRIHVVGLSGTEGSAVVEFLLRHGIASITGHDRNEGERFAEEFTRTHQWLAPAGRDAMLRRVLASPIAFRLGPRYLEGIDGAEVIVAGQAWFRHPENAPVGAARDRGVPLTSMTQLVFETAPCPIIGVTGTNGKFTVAVLIHAMLEASGLHAVMSGNDRTHVPALLQLDDLRPSSWLVLEISNRQLVGLPYSPRIAVLTNVAPHHLDDHGSMEAYVRAKAGIFRHQAPGDAAVVNADNRWTRGLIPEIRSRAYTFSRLEPQARGAFVEGGALRLRDERGTVEVCRAADLAVPGQHTVENALAAALAARLAGAAPEAIAGALRAFRGLPYRLHLAAEVGGVRYYDDSLATNPAAAATGIAAMDRPFVLIAGGARPGATPEAFAPMVEAARGRARAVLLIGRTAPLLAEAFAGAAPAEPVGTLDAAVERARGLARPGDAVLLSPGCESFDQFRDYRERGDRFRALAAAARAGTER